MPDTVQSTTWYAVFYLWSQIARQTKVINQENSENENSKKLSVHDSITVDMSTLSSLYRKKICFSTRWLNCPNMNQRFYSNCFHLKSLRMPIINVSRLLMMLNRNNCSMYVIVACAPPVGSYDPKDGQKVPAAIINTGDDRFKEPKCNCFLFTFIMQNNACCMWYKLIYLYRLRYTAIKCLAKIVWTPKMWYVQ